MTATFDSLATTTLSSAASTIAFNSIPGTFTDLKLVLVGSFSAGARPGFNLNGNTSSLYSQTSIIGSGSSATSNRFTNQTSLYPPNFNTGTNTMFLFTIDLFSYAGSTNKTALFSYYNDQNGSGSIENTVALYRSTSAITSLTLITTSGNYNSGTTATLYGIKAE